jgi:Secretion system C-terminal sorting domain
MISLCLRTSAQWSPDPTVNNAICNFTGGQTFLQMAGDGAGGTICTWVDTRNGTQDIYAQRMNANGTLQWNTDGIAICNAASDQFSPKIINDGSGGAIITWYDNRNGNWDIYAQRIDASGAVQWTADGVAICTQPGNQNAQQIISDGAGGAIIAWSDGRVGGPNADINAQRINASGTVLWVTDGVSVCNANSLQNIPQLVSDGAGGAIITWEDWRNFSQTDIYAQRISFNGFTNWAFNGVVICSDGSFRNQYNTKITSDGSGGAIICWLDNRNSGSNTDIYAQRVNASGLTQWVNDGIVVCTANNIQLTQQMISDGSGGAIIAWEDRRTDRDIYAQRVNISGAIQWAANGIAICNAAGIQEEPQLIARTSGGAILSWTDSRITFQLDIYAQAIDVTGTALWLGNGVPVATEANAQFSSQLVPGNTDEAIIAWQDLRSTLDYDIYSSKLASNGTLPVRLLSFSAVSNKNDVLLTWTTDNETSSSHFDIESSTDGAIFTKLGQVISKNTPGRNQYSFTHVSPAGATLYYRLKQVDIDGRFEYSNTIKVTIEGSIRLILYPNPAGNFLLLKNCRADEIQFMQIISTDGKTVMARKAGNQLQYDITTLKPGLYILKLVKKDGTTSIIRFKKR